MLDKQPLNRPTAVQILQKPFIRKIVDLITEEEIYGEEIAIQIKQ
jgi:hypothetical protein